MKSSVDESQLNCYFYTFFSAPLFSFLSAKKFDGRYEVRDARTQAFLHMYIYMYTLLTTFCLRHSADYIDNHNVIIISLSLRIFRMYATALKLNWHRKWKRKRNNIHYTTTVDGFYNKQ